MQSVYSVQTFQIVKKRKGKKLPGLLDSAYLERWQSKSSNSIFYKSKVNSLNKPKLAFKGTDIWRGTKYSHTDRTGHADLRLQSVSHLDSKPRSLNCLHEIGSFLSLALPSMKKQHWVRPSRYLSKGTIVKKKWILTGIAG